jgi:serine O-acetyltransferase
VLANKLSCSTLQATQLCELVAAAYAADPALVAATHADLQAVLDRDPACTSYVQCLLFFKGFQALQTHRVAHVLWRAGRLPLALALQSRVSEAFHVDIHPAATLGPGLLLDHATGVVIGETAVVGTNVSLLHHVTLGGTGAAGGNRHPKLGDGVLIGAGVSILGPVSVGDGVKVGAGSVVLSDIPARCTAVGVPARVIMRPPKEGAPPELDPALDMDQTSFIKDWFYII